LAAFFDFFAITIFVFGFRFHFRRWT
jgi:hypothetical protein